MATGRLIAPFTEIPPTSDLSLSRFCVSSQHDTGCCRQRNSDLRSAPAETQTAARADVLLDRGSVGGDATETVCPALLGKRVPNAAPEEEPGRQTDLPAQGHRGSLAD